MNAVKTVMGIFVVVVLLGAVMVPVINDATSGGESSETIVNEGAKWLKMNYISDSRDFSVSYSFDGDTLTAANGAATQTGAIEDLILYADEKASIFIDGDDIVLIAQNEGETGSILLDGDITISRTAGVLTVSDSNGDHVSADARAWAYIPDSNGNYASFDEGVKTNAPFAAVGGFAGVYCYNNLVNFDIPLQMDSAYTDDYISSVRWAKPSANLDIDTTMPVILPGGSSILPFDPNPIDTNATDNDDTVDTQALPGMGENVVMAVPTPTYTDGYWGYEYNGDGATIVSYLSNSIPDNIIMPDTVGGRTVLAIGKGGNNENIFTSTQINGHNLTLPSMITSINAFAVQISSGNSGFTGPLVIPDGVISIGRNAFIRNSFAGPLVIPDGVISIGDYAFYSGTGFTGPLVIPKSLTNMGQMAFGLYGGNALVVSTNSVLADDTFANSNISYILNLSDVEYTPTSYGLNADEVRTDIEASQYIGEVNVTIYGDSDAGPMNVLLSAIPFMVIAALFIAVAGIVIRNRLD